MSKKQRFFEVYALLNCMLESSFTIVNKDLFPHSVVTELLFTIRFNCPVPELRLLFLRLINIGYNPFSFPKNTKEYLWVKNIISVIDHEEAKKN